MGDLSLFEKRKEETFLVMPDNTNWNNRNQANNLLTPRNIASAIATAAATAASLHLMVNESVVNKKNCINDDDRQIKHKSKDIGEAIAKAAATLANLQLVPDNQRSY